MRPVRYPRTPCWPTSPQIPREDRVIQDPEALARMELVVTEKLDGSCTLLHQGEAYGRSGEPAGPWAGLARRHHAWKLQDPEMLLYGENVYPVHSICYGPMAPEETFRAFGLCRPDGSFSPFGELLELCDRLDIPAVPVLFEGNLPGAGELDSLIHRLHLGASELGGQREGVVVRAREEIPPGMFGQLACKSVRAGHVQTDQHWRRNWKPCRLTRAGNGEKGV